MLRCCIIVLPIFIRLQSTREIVFSHNGQLKQFQAVVFNPHIHTRLFKKRKKENNGFVFRLRKTMLSAYINPRVVEKYVIIPPLSRSSQKRIAFKFIYLFCKYQNTLLNSDFCDTRTERERKRESKKHSPLIILRPVASVSYKYLVI